VRADDRSSNALRPAKKLGLAVSRREGYRFAIVAGSRVAKPAHEGT
jgi:hypothetical protein